MDQHFLSNLNHTLHDLRTIVDLMQNSVLVQEPEEERNPLCSTPKDQATAFFPASPFGLSPVEAPGQDSRLWHEQNDSLPQPVDTSQDSTYYTALDISPLPSTYSRNNYYQLYYPDDTQNCTVDLENTSDAVGAPMIPCNMPTSKQIADPCCSELLNYMHPGDQDTRMVSLGLEQSLRVRQGSSRATATQADTCSYTLADCQSDMDNVTFDRQQTLSFDVAKNQCDAACSPVSLSGIYDSSAEADNEMERAERRIGMIEEIGYTLDTNHWDLEERQPYNPTLMAGQLLKANLEEDDSGPEYEPEEREALNWLKNKRDEFGYFEQILKEL